MAPVRAAGLKGREKIAQGNALGTVCMAIPSPEGAGYPATIVGYLAPLGLGLLGPSCPRALPWAVLSRRVAAGGRQVIEEFHQS